MAYKREIDRLPIIPPDAEERNVVCHFCIVGCGYKAYTWDIKSRVPGAGSERVRVDLSQQQPPETGPVFAGDV